MNLNPFIDLIATVLSIYAWVLVAWIVLSWLLHFGVVNRHNTFVARLSDVLYRLTEPALRRIRRYMPDLGGIDLSPIVFFLMVRFTISVLYTYFYTHSYGM